VVWLGSLGLVGTLVVLPAVDGHAASGLLRAPAFDHGRLTACAHGPPGGPVQHRTPRRREAHGARTHPRGARWRTAHERSGACAAAHHQAGHPRPLHGPQWQCVPPGWHADPALPGRYLANDAFASRPCTPAHGALRHPTAPRPGRAARKGPPLLPTAQHALEAHARTRTIGAKNKPCATPEQAVRHFLLPLPGAAAWQPAPAHIQRPVFRARRCGDIPRKDRRAGEGEKGHARWRPGNDKA